jgi:flavin-dependent dehydrogenase
MSKQITIIGGGLSGLALANGLRLADIPVEVIEAGCYPRHRVCGEFMAGLSKETLKTLGLESCFADAVRHSTTCFFSKGKPVRTYTLPSTVLGISRHALDMRMAQLVRERGGLVREGVRSDLEDGEGIIQAGGRTPEAGGYCGMKGHWGNLETRADLELHMGRNAYVGLSKVENGDVNVCGLFENIAKGNFDSRLTRFNATLEEHGLSYLADRLSDAGHRAESLCCVSGLHYKNPERNPLTTLGDRHRQIPPFTGNGMTIAIESAAAVLPLAIDYAKGSLPWDAFHQQSDSLLNTQFKHRYRTANFLHPFLLYPSLQSILTFLAKSNLIPFPTLYRLTHA